MPGPLALVRLAKRLPVGNGWRENPTAKSKLAAFCRVMILMLIAVILFSSGLANRLAGESQFCNTLPAK
ncbi:MAG: hypothetical protein WCS70_10540 [Verrucomicrobiota bacterium]